MTPEQAIGMLDRQLARHGDDVSLGRAAAEQGARGLVRGYRPEQLVGLVTQAHRAVTISPTSLNGFEPRERDTFGAGGKLGVVEAAEPVRLNDVVVRWNLRVRIT